MNKKDFDIVFSFLLKDAIRRSPYTQQEVAQKIGISNSSMTRYANGELSPTAKDLYKISEVIDIDYNDLFNPKQHIAEYAKAATISRINKRAEAKKQREAKRRQND